jgi:hypothetical protein
MRIFTILKRMEDRQLIVRKVIEEAVPPVGTFATTDHREETPH